MSNCGTAPQKTQLQRSISCAPAQGWAALGKLNMEPVRVVTVNEDWSALRLRRVEYIKTLTRKFGMLSEEGNKKHEFVIPNF